MSFITLTTDFGTKDHYAGAVKGKILSINPDAKIVDISHEISPYNINHAAYVLNRSWQYYPGNTTHLLGVGSLKEKQNRILIIQKQDHQFVGPDNGAFSLMFGDQYERAYRLKTEEAFGSFPELEYMAEAAALLSLGEYPHTFAEEVQQIKENIPLSPTYDQNSIKAAVLHVDNYQNVILNVKKALFDEVGQGRKFSLNYSRSDFIDQLHNHFGEVPTIEKMCFFNNDGNLTIAINQGKASELLGLYHNSMVIIEFT